MKKLSLMMLALTGMLLASCGGDEYEDWANPQSSAQEDAITLPGYTATAVGAINFADVTDDSIAIYTLNDAALPDGYTLTDHRVIMTPVDATISSDSVSLTTTSEGKVATADLITIVQNAFGKAPYARTFKTHVYADAIYNGTACLIDAGTVDVVMTLEAPKISSTYYVIGGAVDWTPDAARTQVFSHSSTNVYDDPVFTITIPAAASGDTWFAIADDDALDAITNNNDWSQLLGTTKGNGANAYDGTTETLDYRYNLSDDGSFCVPSSTGAKYIKIEINMMDATYSITALSFQPTMYVAGDGNGWAQIDYLTTSTYDGNYDGYMYLGTQYKICTQQNWDGTNYGADFSTDGGAANMTVDGDPGYYKMHVNFITSTVELTPITTIGVVGDATAGGWDSDQDMTYNQTDRCWEIDNLTLTDGTIKFRANDDWDINWGGTADNLTQGGANISVTAGTYSIKLYAWADGFAKCTITKN
ncbi:MAG: DUF5115 domain-containing protein [Prevotella sp.]|jgi:hypothetical protein